MQRVCALASFDPAVCPTVVVADAYPNFSICGIAYWLSGEISERRDLAHRTREDLERAGLSCGSTRCLPGLSATIRLHF